MGDRERLNALADWFDEYGEYIDQQGAGSWPGGDVVADRPRVGSVRHLNHLVARSIGVRCVSRNAHKRLMRGPLCPKA